METAALKNKKLCLKNDGALSLFFAGAGSAFSKRLYQTNLLIIKGEDHLLIDCGTKFTQSLYEAGLAVTDIENIIITHSHADHIGGLEEAALMGRYFSKKKPNMFITETYQQMLWDMSLRGGCACNEVKNGVSLQFEDLFNVYRPEKLKDFPRDTYEFNIGSINIKMFRTKHIPDDTPDWKTSVWSCGVVIDNRVLFTGDTRYDEDLILGFDERFHFENIFHDCQFFTGGVHASLDELNSLPAEIKKKTVLMHYGDNWEKFEDRALEYGFTGLAKQHIYYQFK